MKIEWLSILGLTIVIALTFVFFEVNPQQFQQPGFLQQSINMTAISVQTDVGQEVSTTLWGQRQLDLIVLAFVLFATATCCRAMLRVEEEKK